GKVRKQTPKVEGKERHSPIPRRGLRNKYVKRVILGRYAGQAQSMGAKRRSR
ncbi:MAG: 30S ribosomal protein S30e, partial [Candidatus Heimdallarchaeota archaeon]|nr:30S ribosomal protein S30e [Candidatus Heimdallarchaeota archaeon]MCK5145076.1 30S ribosomal protein S30e [Candidatus Heimdallarchaeota archaeon]